MLARYRNRTRTKISESLGETYSIQPDWDKVSPRSGKKKALPSKTQAQAITLAEDDSNSSKVILLEATGTSTEAKLQLKNLSESHPGVPVILILDTQRTDIDGFLALPASDFHDFQSHEALLQKRVAKLSHSSKAQPLNPLSFRLIQEEMQLWQSLFERSGAGMLTGQARLFLGALRRTTAALPAPEKLETLTLGDTLLSNVIWELNNKESTQLLELKEPVSLSNQFLKKLKPSNPQQFLESLGQLGTAVNLIHEEVQYTTELGNQKHLSIGISIASEKDNLLLMTILDNSQRVQLEGELRDNLKLLEGRVAQRTHDIALSHQRLASEGTQRQKLTAQLRESLAHITQSVIGAKRIMEVALPSREELNSIFPHSLLIDRPRDIMGGDFLFTGVKNGKKTLALIDSTGHGIPGAMVSLMGSSLINKAFTALESSNPSAILESFQKEFDIRMQVNQGTPQMYGFDAAIMTMDPETNTIEFAGARGDLFRVRDRETMAVRGSRTSIDLMGKHSPNAPSIEYKLHTLDYQDGDQFYMISDGIRDQFGGERNRKMGRKRLCDILAKHSTLPSAQREKAIQKDLLIWKGANAKVDDATLVGIQC